MTVEFSPKSWLREADEISDVSRRASARASDALEGTQVAGGRSMIDHVIHEHLSRLRTEGAASASGWQAALNSEAERMQSTGQNYHAIEAANEAAAQRLAGS
ncbi:MAG: hypothetical protein Q4P15_08975 [Propionibacteriaceae bacterium]|nr:hypothetical protein [Propionibacteriaceae bacterium]